MRATEAPTQIELRIAESGSDESGMPGSRAQGSARAVGGSCALAHTFTWTSPWGATKDEAFVDLRTTCCMCICDSLNEHIACEEFSGTALRSRVHPSLAEAALRKLKK